jgi:hypothetical protein
MLVSHRHRFIYTKTAKTAGTSVEVYFEPFCIDEPSNSNVAHGGPARVSGAGIIGYRGPRRPSDCVWWNHMPAADIKRLLGDETWNAYFKFCVIRNPYDKVISFFYFLRNRARIQIDSTLSEREQFQHWVMQGRLSVGRDRYVIDGKFCLDDVIRYERLEAEMERICQRIDVPWVPSAFLRLKTGKRPRSSNIDNMYSAEAAEVVRRQYAFEFEQFGYATDLEHYGRSSGHTSQAALA